MVEVVLEGAREAEIAAWHSILKHNFSYKKSTTFSHLSQKSIDSIFSTCCHNNNSNIKITLIDIRISSIKALYLGVLIVLTALRSSPQKSAFAIRILILMLRF